MGHTRRTAAGGPRGRGGAKRIAAAAFGSLEAPLRLARRCRDMSLVLPGSPIGAGVAMTVKSSLSLTDQQDAVARECWIDLG